METAQLVDFDELLYEKNGLFFFKKQLFTGVMYKEIEEKEFFEDCLIELSCVKNGTVSSPIFPKRPF